MVGVTVITGLGFTVILKVCVSPWHPEKLGVTVNMPIVGVEPVLVAVNEGRELPDPLAPMPIDVLLLFQSKAVPDTLLVKTSAAVPALLHALWLVGVIVITGLGSAEIVNVCVGPGQVLAVGVTVNTPLVITLLVLVRVNEARELPVPLAPTPIVVLLLFQV